MDEQEKEQESEGMPVLLLAPGTFRTGTETFYAEPIAVLKGDGNDEATWTAQAFAAAWREYLAWKATAPNGADVPRWLILQGLPTTAILPPKRQRRGGKRRGR